MAGVNKVILVGNLGRDPRIAAKQNGERIASFSLATSESWRDKATGERRERTEWHNVVVFNEALVKVVEEHVRKGSKVYVEGQNATRKWTDKDGIERYTTEVVLRPYRGTLALLDRAEKAPEPDEDAYGTTTTRDGGGGAGGYDDEIPL